MDLSLKEYTILFEDLELTPWTKIAYPNANEKPDLKHTYAIGFAIKTHNFEENEISIYDIYLIKNNNEQDLLSSYDNLTGIMNGEMGRWHAMGLY